MKGIVSVATHSSGNHAAALAGRRFDDLSVDQGVKPTGLDIMLLPKQLIRQGAEIGQNWGKKFAYPASAAGEPDYWITRIGTLPSGRILFRSLRVIILQEPGQAV